MKKENRTAAYNSRLRIGAYRFRGIDQSFPCHFHDYYTIGLVEQGERILSCQGREYLIREGAILLFNPGDSHGCVPREDGALDYRGLTIPREVMAKLAERAAGLRELPRFSPNVLLDEEAACSLRPLHQMIMDGSGDAVEEEGLLFLLALLIRRYGRPLPCCAPEHREEVEAACAFMEEHFARRITLEELCRVVGMSRSALLRAFPQVKGVTPYRYLENIRIARAEALLERGIPPVRAALETGFSDQSHFTNCFGQFIGLAPGAYGKTFRDRKDGQNGLAK